MIIARRLSDQPIIHPGLHPSLGENINGPSLIEPPADLPGRLARFYLYFAHHTGDHIRLALADDLLGPWRIHRPAVLHLAQTDFAQTAPDLPQPDWAVAQGVDGLYPHIASPDVHWRPELGGFEMWLHGMDADGEQRSIRAVSPDGLSWRAGTRRTEQTYLKVFDWQGARLALGHGGQILFADGATGFRLGPRPFPTGFRHGAVLVEEGAVHVLWTRIGDAPERIWISRLSASWEVLSTTELMRPERAWEGADLPVTPSRIGAAALREHALRDPEVVHCDGRSYLIYAGGGEAALGLAELERAKVG